MAYEITMPILSDTMESGKLIKWHVKPGDRVKKGDVIAEVESDKAIMEVQSFKDGIVEELKAKEGEEVPVKKVIAVIKPAETAEKTPPPPVDLPPSEKKETPPPDKTNPILDIIGSPVESSHPPFFEASPAARKKAAELGLDGKRLQEEGRLPRPAHLKDLESLWLERYFTPAARKTMERFGIDPLKLKRERKVTREEVEAYARAHHLSERIEISSNQKAIISHMKKAAAKPVYRIYDRLDLSNIPRTEEIKLTSWIVKLFADTMAAFPTMRTIYREESFWRYAGANIAVAVATDEALYTPVLKNADEMAPKEIDDWIRKIKKKAITGDFKPEEFKDSSLGISNLGMFGIEAFDALINRDDCAMAAIGAMREHVVSVTVAFDHRVVNGKEGARFIQALKERANDARYIRTLA